MRRIIKAFKIGFSLADDECDDDDCEVSDAEDDRPVLCVGSWLGRVKGHRLIRMQKLFYRNIFAYVNIISSFSDQKKALSGSRHD